MTNAERVVSMTGFGSAILVRNSASIEVEVRSVNARYLDVTVRAPDELRAMEPAIRDVLSKGMRRGKVEVRVNLRHNAVAAVPTLDHDALTRLLALQAQTLALAPTAAALSMAELLRWPGVVADSSVTNDAESLLATGLEAFTQARAQHEASREREGAALTEIILARVTSAAAIAAAMVPAAERVRAQYPAKLRAKIESAGVAIDPERLAQEIVLHAQRIDIDEELDRLNTHLAEVRRVLAKGGEVGKRLDFLMQELNRESNTLGSKSVDVETTRAAIDLKVLIEQIREQIQNLQ